MKDQGLLPRLSARLGELTRTNSEALVGAQTDDRRYRKEHGAREGRLHPGRRDHLLDPPRRQHPHRAGPLRQGLQRDGRACRSSRSPTRRPPGCAAGSANMAKHPAARRPFALQPPLVRADHHRPGHAVAGQLPDDVPQAGRHRQGPAHRPPGPRRAQPDPDPGGHPQRPRSSPRRSTASPGQQRRRADGHPADRPLPRRLPDRRDARRRASSTRTTGCTATPASRVVDGSAVSANLGVNPSLTITAQAERAMSFWPNKGEADPRPAQGAAYERLAPVEPLRAGGPEGRVRRAEAAVPGDSGGAAEGDGGGRGGHRGRGEHTRTQSVIFLRATVRGAARSNPYCLTAVTQRPPRTRGPR